MGRWWRAWTNSCIWVVRSVPLTDQQNRAESDAQDRSCRSKCEQPYTIWNQGHLSLATKLCFFMTLIFPTLPPKPERSTRPTSIVCRPSTCVAWGPKTYLASLVFSPMLRHWLRTMPYMPLIKSKPNYPMLFSLANNFTWHLDVDDDLLLKCLSLASSNFCFYFA